MWEKLRVVFTIPELRQKILLTLLFLAIYRVGWWIPLPIVDNAKMAEFFGSQGEGGLGTMLKQVATFSATTLDQATIFGLGIMPYISASIIFQLLASVWRPLEELKRKGKAARRKLTNTPATPRSFSAWGKAGSTCATWCRAISYGRNSSPTDTCRSVGTWWPL